MAALATAAVAASAPEAQACSGTAAGNDFSVLPQIPENGQLIGHYTCKLGTTCSFPDTLDVFDSAGQPVAGELTIFAAPDQTRATYTFRPAQPWTPGRSYSVTDLATPPLGGSNSTFRVMPAVTLDAERVATHLVLLEDRTPLREVCCDESRDSCGQPYCVALESLIELRVRLDLTPPADSMGQWLSRLHAVDVGATATQSAVAEIVSPWGHPSLHVVEQRSSYCVQIELSNLVDGTTILREPQCLEHGDMPSIGPANEDLTSAAQGISQCAYPREGIESPWCAGTAARCESDPPDADACARFEQYCVNDGGPGDSEAPGPPPEDAQPDGSCGLVQRASPAHDVRSALLPLAAAALAAGLRRGAGRRRLR